MTGRYEHSVKIQNGAVVGSRLMGSGIAEACGHSGYEYRSGPESQS